MLLDYFRSSRAVVRHRGQKTLLDSDDDVTLQKASVPSRYAERGTIVTGDGEIVEIKWDTPRSWQCLWVGTVILCP